MSAAFEDFVWQHLHDRRDYYKARIQHWEQVLQTIQGGNPDTVELVELHIHLLKIKVLKLTTKINQMAWNFV